MSSGNYGGGGGVVSDDGLLFNAGGDKIGTFVGVLQDDGTWVYYGEDGLPFVPDFTGGEYIEWASPSLEVDNAPADPTIQCFVRDKTLDEPTNKPATAGGKGYVTLDTYTVNQFANEGNIGLADAEFHSIVIFDTDGVPAVNGEKVTTNENTINIVESNNNGALFVWEGYIFNPTRYPNTNAGKYVSKASIVSIGTDTDRADYEWLAIASSGGKYSLDRKDLQPVAQGASSGARNPFQLDPSQKGQWVRFAYAHGDKGGKSSGRLKMELTYEDGSSNTYAITSFIHQPGALVSHCERKQEILQYNTTTSEWSIDGTVVTDVIAGARNMSQLPCTRQPITFDAYVSAGSVSFSSMFGGNNDTANFEYSIDGGTSWQSTPSFSLSGTNSREILPMVRDSDGQKSTIIGASGWINCSSGSWSADLITPDNGDTEYDDGIGVRGFVVDYSTDLGQSLESTNSALSWSLTNATQDVNFIYLGNTFVDSNCKAEALLAPILTSTTTGQEYTVAFNPYMYYLSAANTTVDFSAKIIDTVTNSVLGVTSWSWGGNTMVSLANQLVSFTGTGNPVKLVFESVVPPMTDQWWGNIANATLTTTSIQKTASAGWNTRISSGQGKKPSTGEVVFSFKVLGAGNRGMHGLDGDYIDTSYAGGDYLFYIPNDSTIYVYENGVNRALSNSSYSPGDLLEIKISTSGVVTYWCAGTLRLTSPTNADVNRTYWTSSFPYQTGTGIQNYEFNGDIGVVLPDVAGHYIRIDQVRLFKGAYSDASHHAKVVGNDIFFRNIDGVATCLFDQHKYSDDVTLRPEFNLVRHGTWTDKQKIKLLYQINNGVWVEMLHQEGQWDVANELYLSPFTYGKHIDLPAGDKIRYKIEVFGNAVGDTGVYLRGASDSVVC